MLHQSDQKSNGGQARPLNAVAAKCVEFRVGAIVFQRSSSPRTGRQYRTRCSRKDVVESLPKNTMFGLSTLTVIVSGKQNAHPCGNSTPLLVQLEGAKPRTTVSYAFVVELRHVR